MWMDVLAGIVVFETDTVYSAGSIEIPRNLEYVFFVYFTHEVFVHGPQLKGSLPERVCLYGLLSSFLVTFSIL